MGSSSAGSSDSNEGFGPQPVKTKPKKSILDYSPTVQLVKGVYKAVKGAIDKRNPGSKINDPTGLYAEGLTKGKPNYNVNRNSGGDSDNRPTATNVGGTIVKVPSPTTSEISQSNATDVTYDERKTKAKGRTMTILTSAKGVGKDDKAVLGKKSLLGRA